MTTSKTRKHGGSTEAIAWLEDQFELDYRNQESSELFRITFAGPIFVLKDDEEDFDEYWEEEAARWPTPSHHQWNLDEG